MFKGNEQFTTLCKRKDWTTVFCITAPSFCLKSEFTFCKTRDCVLITIPAPWSWDSSTPWKKSQIKDNHLKKYISKMSKPSLDFLKSICQQLFLVFSARIVSLLLSFTNYFCHSESGQVYTPSKMDLLSTPASKKWLFNSNSAADNDLSWSLLKYLLSLHNVNTSIGCTPKETAPVPCRITMYCMSTWIFLCPLSNEVFGN